MTITANTQIGDITSSNLELLSKTPDGKSVVKRVKRILPEWLSVDDETTVIQPEKIYKIGSGTNYKLGEKQGLYQLFNATTADVTITVENGAFDDSTTTVTVSAGNLFQSRCTGDAPNRVYTRLSIKLGTEAATTTPPDSNEYNEPVSNNALEPGYYMVSGGTTYTLIPLETDAANLPKEWYFYNTDDTDAIVTFDANQPDIDLINDDDGTTTTVSNDFQISVNKDEVIKLVLENANGISNYRVKTHWTKPETAVGESRIKNNFGADREPTANDDTDSGYEAGSIWSFGDKVWVATSVSDNAANWVLIADTPPESNPDDNASPDTEYNLENAADNYSNNAGLPPGYYNVVSPNSYQYSLGIGSSNDYPATWIFHNPETDPVAINLSVTSAGTLSWNKTDGVNGLNSLPAGSFNVGGGETWKVYYYEPTEERKTEIRTELGLVETIVFTSVIEIERIKSSDFANETITKLGERNVIRLSQPISADAFKPLTLYLLDVQENIQFTTKKYGKVFDLDNNKISTASGNFNTYQLEKGKNYFAYAVSNDLILWEVAKESTSSASGGIPTVTVFPTDLTITTVRMISNSNPTILDGIYTRDRNNNWVI